MSVKATNFVRSLRGLTPVEKAVAFVLADHDNHHGNGSYASMTTVAEEAGLKNRQTASKIVKRLLDRGVIWTDRVSKGRVTTVYRFPINRNSQVAVEQDSNRNSGTRQPQLPTAPTATLDASNRNSPVAGRVEGEEKREKGEPSPSSSDGQVQTESAAGDVVTAIKMVDLNATVTGKDRKQIAQVLSSANVVDQGELFSLIRDRVSAMDAFERKHAGSTIASELSGLLAASRKAQQDRQAQRNRLDELNALAEQISKRDRAKYEAEQKKRDEENAYAAAHAHEI